MKATALQRMTNGALRAKGSPYRISEISIAATIPPGVNFAISRIDDVVEALEEVRESRQLVEEAPSDGEVVLALDGAHLDQTTAEAIALSGGSPDVPRARSAARTRRPAPPSTRGILGRASARPRGSGGSTAADRPLRDLDAARRQ